MLFQLNTYVLLHCLTFLVTLVVIIIALRRLAIHSSKSAFLKMMFAIAIYSFFAIMEAGSIIFWQKIAWSTLEFLGLAFTLIYFLFFSIHLDIGYNFFNLRQKIGVWFVPIGNFFLVVFNDCHHLVWTGFKPHPTESNIILYQHDWGFTWISICAYLYVFWGMFYLIRAIINSSLLSRRHAIFALLGTLFPLIAGTGYVLELTPLGLNIIPLSFLLTGMTYLIGITLYQMFDVIPVARDTLIENLADGVLVLDLKKRIVDLNPALKTILQLPKDCLGQLATELLPDWQELLCITPEKQITEVKLLQQQYIEVRIMPLRDRATRIIGYLFVFRDITHPYIATQKLRQVNQRLKTQLRKIISLQSQLQEQAMRDGLTKVYNRRYFEEKIEQELQQAKAKKQPFAIVLIDVDYFKKINDSFGHQAGDLVLEILGQILIENSGEQGIPCRYGGEEFAIAFPQTNLATAYQKAEKIRQTLAQTRIIYENQVIPTTLSGGVGCFPDHGRTRDTVLSNIDRALYLAKAEGRNCIRSVSDLLPS
ncbi:MAG: diguanylate cyclase [Jaaginema sp. PMC 1079.18]|nr:diguanylate cyclase [Jaaginema sp. PMC 1080.18]MEC4853067.1 diguanylate cyclase [Jaaginema sp. PMC 1079.18]MEC4868114.1 diguanylate cyclase [Jaaginema sp. PMC 1078.18]